MLEPQKHIDVLRDYLRKQKRKQIPVSGDDTELMDLLIAVAKNLDGWPGPSRTRSGPDPDEARQKVIEWVGEDLWRRAETMWAEEKADPNLRITVYAKPEAAGAGAAAGGSQQALWALIDYAEAIKLGEPRDEARWKKLVRDVLRDLEKHPDRAEVEDLITRFGGVQAWLEARDVAFPPAGRGVVLLSTRKLTILEVLARLRALASSIHPVKGTSPGVEDEAAPPRKPLRDVPRGYDERLFKLSQFRLLHTRLNQVGARRAQQLIRDGEVEEIQRVAGTRRYRLHKNLVTAWKL